MGSEVHGLSPEMPFCAAAKPAIGQKLDELFQHEAGTRAGNDIEALHDMRVASRRLRSAMDMFGVCYPASQFKPLAKLARSLTRALGEVRDRDVLIESLERYAKKAPADEKPGVADLVIRSLLDKQQFADPQGDAERLGISSSLWPLFGLLWPSGSHLAARLGARSVIETDRILEIGCGLGLARLVGTTLSSCR